MNNNEMQVETVETAAEAEVTTSDELDAFDSVWDGDDQNDDDEDWLEADETEGGEAEADQHEAEHADASENAEQTEQTEERKDETADQRFTLKHLDDVREVGRDEVIALAQKGMDYDRKTQKLNDKIDGYEAFLKELAAPANLTIEQLIDTTRARIYRANEANEGREISETDALLKIQADRANAVKSSEEQARQAEQQRQEDVKRNTDAEIQRFVAEYPNVKAEDIPQSVWEEFQRTGNLLGPYSRYENDALRKEIEALKQNKKNEERSTGSRRTAGSRVASDPFDAAWED